MVRTERKQVSFQGTMKSVDKNTGHKCWNGTICLANNDNYLRVQFCRNRQIMTPRGRVIWLNKKGGTKIPYLENITEQEDRFLKDFSLVEC